MDTPTLTLPIPPTWIRGATRLALHVASERGGVTDIIRFRVGPDGAIVLDYPKTEEAVNGPA